MNVSVRKVAYLSASALHLLEERPIEFYLRRLGPVENEPEREPQSFPAAVGIAFDCFVKQRVARQLGLPCPSQAFMLAEIAAGNRDRATALGATLTYGYERCGALVSLLEDGIQAVHYDVEDFAPGTQVPVRAKLDAITSRGPHDWKVKGANRPGQASPSQGYDRLWDTDRPGDPGDPHKRCGEPLEALDPDWATQLCIYWWALGSRGTEAKVSLDEVVVGENERVRVAQFRAKVSPEFQTKIVERLQDAWDRIRSDRVLPDWARHLEPDALRALA